MNAGAWAREGVILLVSFIEALFAINQTRVIVIKIGQPIDEDATNTGGNGMTIVLNNEQKVSSTVSGRDADGQAVPVTGLTVDVIDAGVPPIFTVEMVGDDTFVVHSVEPANPGDVTVGTGSIRVNVGGDSLDVVVVVETSEVTAITVASGAPEPE